MNDRLDHDSIDRENERYSARVSLFSHETCACRVLFALMKTLANSKEKNENEKYEIPIRIMSLRIRRYLEC